MRSGGRILEAINEVTRGRRDGKPHNWAANQLLPLSTEGFSNGTGEFILPEWFGKFNLRSSPRRQLGVPRRQDDG